MEPRAALGHLRSAETGRYTLYAGSGGAVAKNTSSQTCSASSRNPLRVLASMSAAISARRTGSMSNSAWSCGPPKSSGRPVKYTATRSEAFLSDYQGRDLATRVELALDKEGRFLAMRADNISNVGARCVSLSPLGKGSALITGSYDIPVATLRARAVFTNTMPTQAYRSSGRPEVTFAIERLIDMAAVECGFDRARAAAQEPRCARSRCPTPMRSARPTTAAPTRPTWTAACACRLGRRPRRARRDAAARGKLLGLRLRQLCGILHRLAEGARRDHGPSGGRVTW